MRVDLGGVAETLLWTLYHRAAEARRPDGVLRDQAAVDLVDRLDYPFEERFGRAGSLTTQIQGLRGRVFDEQVRAFLDRHPDGTVVALGDGLETQFWRVDNGHVHWLSVDLPEVIELRRRVLAGGERMRTVAGSATDLAWMDRVDARPVGVLVVAQGLLMYLPPDEVRRLITACAARFPVGGMVLDAVPRWFAAFASTGRLRTPTGFQAPPMPWGLNVDEQPRLRDLHPNITAVRDLPLPRGRGLVGRLFPGVKLVPVLRHKRPSAVLLSFGTPGG